MINLILCGGSGTRLWPISRSLMPKQFARLFDGASLFQRTVKTNSRICEAQYIVSNADQYFLAKDQLEEVGADKARFLLEPVGRNTAPAIALACLGLNPDDIVLVSPSDHVIRKAAAYEECLRKAQEFAEKGFLVTFGITPTGPETGYGYIEADGEDVKRFVEKPDLETAKKYVASGRFFWNSGIFCFKASTFLSELEAFSPDILNAAKIAFVNAKKENRDSLIRVNHDDMMNIPSNSIDYAVMEKSSKVKVVPSDIGWSDLGAFDSLYGEYEHDENGNNINAKHLGIGSKNSLVLGGQRQICTIDLDNMLIVDTPDALLVAPLASSQKVKKVVDELKARGSDLPTVPQTVNRPWGTYSVLESTDRYKMKRIVVRPGERLSLQKHLHRSEHWVVVSGTATVTVGDKVFYVRPNESTYIPSGTIHRLQNEGKLPLVIVEVQVGEYTGEDDIIRVQDDYKRS
ncbi:MAG: mannose-1-phosphate guanylyltransferase/mannose-6-phosphate isomerase [Fibrobacter sp.]|uniref:mannose-1-phosphate guanylyltransferase/mannose-6-phosphate isomerase n=1 Tax=Fibrobacter sp. TaxID=35828 RepID=UPI0025C3564B|nr:mannose-1-phosphate guanylyltransferase/mannose-6-phosphate isomerase [Fibrobacter sp.]MBQ7081411.1 mannose-1-phosphate guanylyltransferase/mannose-6-phosphate isomerase [Fibrobacter sp.]